MHRDHDQLTPPIAAILGWRAPELSKDAEGLFAACKPWGFILFAEACKSRAQVRDLVAALKATTHSGALIFIDQEGGRVARLKAPEWPLFPAASRYGALFQRDRALGLEACRLGHRLIAHELAALGVHADCAPCLDLPAEGSDPIIGDRAFGTDPDQIAALGAAALEGLHAGGVAGVIKHLPGHGRANVDSHLALPRVDAGRQALAQDFAPFKALRMAPMAMTAHVLFESLDEAQPATTSPTIIENIIRQEIGFDGLLMTDDLGMKALNGSWWEKADGAFLAGCDIALHCSGEMAEMESLAAACPPLAGKALARAKAAEAVGSAAPEPFDAQAGRARLDQLLGAREALV
jgi:beta-N-acetylhexosaminidase